jgi:hypothetical protein
MYSRFASCLAAGVFIVGSQGQICGADIDQTAVLKAHAAALTAIRSFDVSAESYYQKPDEQGHWEPEVKSSQVRWSKDGARERCRRDNLRRLFSDDFFDGSQLWMLNGWNPHAPPKLTPRSQQRVRAVVRPASQLDAATSLAVEFLFAFRLTGAASKDRTQLDECRTLAELVAKSPKVEFHIEPPSGKDGKLIVLTVSLPSIGDDPPGGDYFVITLDPAVNYLVRRVEEHNLKHVISIPKLVEHGVFVREVTQFREVDKGVFFPIETRERVIRQSSNEVLSKARFVVTTIVVNQPLPKDALEFRFPNNAVVTKILDNNKSKVEAWLWGPDNRPAKRIRSPKDLFGN